MSTIWSPALVRLLRSGGFPGTANLMSKILIQKMRDAAASSDTLGWGWGDTYNYMFGSGGGSVTPPSDLKAVADKVWGLCPDCERPLLDSYDTETCDWLVDPKGNWLRFCSPTCIEAAMKQFIIEHYDSYTWDRIEADMSFGQLRNWSNVNWFVDRLSASETERWG